MPLGNGANILRLSERLKGSARPATALQRLGSPEAGELLKHFSIPFRPGHASAKARFDGALVHEG